jgi:hypothetical protein
MFNWIPLAVFFVITQTLTVGLLFALVLKIFFKDK